VWPVEANGTYTFSAFIRDISERHRAEAALRESEEKYRLVVENAYEGIVVSQDGMLKFANPRALELTERTLEQAMTTPFIEMVHPDDRARVYGNYLRRLRGEPVEPFYVFRAVSSTGEVRSLQISAVAIQWQGRPATLNFLTDVTKQVALQGHLTETLAEREAILETTAVGIMFIQNGRIKWINDALERSMLGWADGELIGRTGEVAFIDHDDWSRFLKECIPALERDGTYSVDWHVRRKDGSAWWCHMSAKALDPANLGAGTDLVLPRHLGAQARGGGGAARAHARARALGAEDPLRLDHLARVPHPARHDPLLDRAARGLRPRHARQRAPRGDPAGQGRGREDDRDDRPGDADRPGRVRPARVPPRARRPRRARRRDRARDRAGERAPLRDPPRHARPPGTADAGREARLARARQPALERGEVFPGRRRWSTWSCAPPPRPSSSSSWTAASASRPTTRRASSKASTGRAMSATSRAPGSASPSSSSAWSCHHGSVAFESVPGKGSVFLVCLPAPPAP
jgi:PAS domain S-box-containing protein